MLIDATVFEARLRAAEARLRKEADMLTTTEVNSNGSTGTKVEPEAVQMLKSAEDFRALADEVAAIAAQHGGKHA